MSNIRYSDIYKIYESKDCFYLFRNKVQVFIISKKGFTKGNVTDFSKFINDEIRN